jgi:hypothetical protein
MVGESNGGCDLTSRLCVLSGILSCQAVRRIARLPDFPDPRFLGKPLSSCYLEGTLSVSLSQGGSHDSPLASSSALATDLGDVESGIPQSQSTIQVSTHRNQRTAGSCKHHCGRSPEIHSRSFQTRQQVLLGFPD